MTRRQRSERGSSLVESLILGILLLLPVSFMVVEFGEIQRAAIGVSAASREAGRAFVTSRTTGEAESRARKAAGSVIAGHHLDSSRATVRIAGELKRGSEVRVEVAYRTPEVPVPLLGSIPGLTLQSAHVEIVDRHRSIEMR
ncbi:MAG: pilus assembly protein TadE [Acidobacteria bacterium]|nr:MAG: pilus assembly protein TadE [Acidobacteriota bacterium]